MAGSHVLAGPFSGHRSINLVVERHCPSFVEPDGTNEVDANTIAGCFRPGLVLLQLCSRTFLVQFLQIPLVSDIH